MLKKVNEMKNVFALAMVALFLVVLVSGCIEQTPIDHTPTNKTPNNTNEGINQGVTDSGSGGDDLINQVTSDLSGAENLDSELADPDLDTLSEDLEQIDW